MEDGQFVGGEDILLEGMVPYLAPLDLILLGVEAGVRVGDRSWLVVMGHCC